MVNEEQLNFFATILEQTSKDPGNFVAFRETLSIAIYTLDLTVTQLADEFAASRPTIGRWITGSSHPTEAMVKAVYRWFEKKLKEETHGRKSQKKQRKGTSSKA